MTIRGGPPLSNTRTSLPQIKSKFDLEPNPFEQSFKHNPNHFDKKDSLSLSLSPSISNHQQNTNSPSLNHLLNAPEFSPNNHFNNNQNHSYQLNLSNNNPSLPLPLPHSHSHSQSPPLIRSTPGGSLVKVQLPGINSITSPAILLQHSINLNNNSQSLPNMPNPISPFSWAFAPIPSNSSSSPKSSINNNNISTSAPSASVPPAAPPSTSHSGLTPLIEIANSNHSGPFTPATQALIALFSSDHSQNQIPSSSHLPVSSALSSSAKLPPDLPKLIPVSLPLSASQNVDPIAIHTDQKNLDPSRIINDPPPTSLPSSSAPFDIPSQLKKSALLPTSPLSSHKPSPVSVSISVSASASASVSAGPYMLDSALPSKLSLSHPPPLPSSSLPFSDPPRSPTSPILKLDSTSTSSAHSNPSSLERASLPTLHSLSPVGLPTAPSSFPCSNSASRSSLPQLTPLSTISLSGTLAPSPHSALDPLPANALGPPTLLPANPTVAMDEHYNTNPLYLLTVAHEASAQLSQLNSHSHHNDAVDDATVTAAAALTGLGSSGGSRYSSPGPNPVANGTNPAHQHLANHVSQSIAIKRAGVGSTSSSPTLSAPRSTIGPSSGSSLGASLMSRGTITGTTSDERTRFGTGTYAGTFGSGGASVGEGTSTGNQSGGGSGPSSGKRKAKRRKEPGEDEGCEGPEDEKRPEGLAKAAGSRPRRTQGPGESSPLMAGGRTGCGLSSPAKGQQQRTGGKLKKGKKAKMEEGSGGDESDGREPFWGMDDEMGYQPNADEAGGSGGGEGGERLGGANNQGGGGSGGGSQGRPETEEEKRKNFLERNRQAALKCRQRKKAWLANLQSKVEYLSSENETLQETISRLQEEIESIRSILVSHQDCPISVNVQVGGSVGKGSSSGGSGQGGGGGAQGNRCRTIGELVGSGGDSVSGCVGGLLVQQQQAGRTGGTLVGIGQSQTRQSVGLGGGGHQHHPHHQVNNGTSRVIGNEVGVPPSQHLNQQLVGQQHQLVSHPNPNPNPNHQHHQHQHQHQQVHQVSSTNSVHLHHHHLHHQAQLSGGIPKHHGHGVHHSSNGQITGSGSGGAGTSGAGTGSSGSSGAGATGASGTSGTGTGGTGTGGTGTGVGQIGGQSSLTQQQQHQQINGIHHQHQHQHHCSSGEHSSVGVGGVGVGSVGLSGTSGLSSGSSNNHVVVNTCSAASATTFGY